MAIASAALVAGIGGIRFADAQMAKKVVLVTGDSLVVEATEEVDVHVSVLEQTV